MAFNSKIFLIDVEPRLNPDTGKNKLEIVHETPVYADKQEVGMNEYYSAVGAGRTLLVIYEIPSHMYNGEQYILTDDRTRQLYVSRVAKGRSLAYIKLPCTSVPKKSLLEGMKSG